MDAHAIARRFHSKGGDPLTRMAQDFALMLYANTPDRRCCDAAVEKVEEALMWAEKGSQDEWERMA